MNPPTPTLEPAERLWASLYPERGPWSTIGEEARAEWRRFLEVALAQNAAPIDRVKLWEAINEYTAACGGNTGAEISHHNTRRMEAVVAVENALPVSNLHSPTSNFQSSADYAFAALGRQIYAKVTGHVADGECDEWCEDVMKIATDLSLAKQEIYNPEIHGHNIEAEPGVDPIWTWSHLPKGWKTGLPAARFIDPATGQDQPDPSQRGILIL